MSIFDLKKVSKEYLREVKKQTDPYGYFCKKEQIKRGEQRNSSCPPFCIVDNLHNLIFEDEEKEGAFETDKRYWMKTGAGTSIWCAFFAEILTRLPVGRET